MLATSSPIATASPLPPRPAPVRVDDLLGIADGLWPGQSNDEVMDRTRDRRAG